MFFGKKMRKLFKDAYINSLDILGYSWFSILVLILTPSLFLFVYRTLQVHGSSQENAFAIITASLLTIPTTFLTITIPLRQAILGKQRDEQKELRRAYSFVAVSVGFEVLDNLNLLEYFRSSVDVDYHIDSTTMNKLTADLQEKIIKMSAIQNIAEMFDRSLSNSVFLATTSSGIYGKIEDIDFLNCLNLTY